MGPLAGNLYISHLHLSQDLADLKLETRIVMQYHGYRFLVDRLYYVSCFFPCVLGVYFYCTKRPSLLYKSKLTELKK